MNQSKADAISAQLLCNAAMVRYGSVSVTAKLHNGRVVELTYTKTEMTKEKTTEDPKQNDKNKIVI